MSFFQYCDKCDMETRHIAKEKLGKDKDLCIPCSRREESSQEKTCAQCGLPKKEHPVFIIREGSLTCPCKKFKEMK